MQTKQKTKRTPDALSILRAKIATKVVGIFALLGMLGFSVYASSLQTLSVSNYVSFVANAVQVTVVGNVSGVAGIAPEQFSATVGADDHEGDELGTWATGFLGFEQETAPIMFVIDVTNNSGERFVAVSIGGFYYQAMNGANMYSLINPALPDEESNREYTNISRSLTFKLDDMTTPVVWDGLDNPMYHIAPNGSAQIVVSLSIVDTGRSVNSFINNFFVMLDNVPNA